MIIPVFIQEITSKIEDAGFEAFVVGGCVRDMLLKKSPNDWDITTSALPDDILDIFKDRKTLSVGIKHGTIAVEAECGFVEITTFRTDGYYLDNRHPQSVNFSKSIADDLKRRDFTINAMAFSQNSGLIDLFGGQDDLSKGIIRCVGNPGVRFSEDALRIMRGLRFAAVLGFEIEQDTTEALLSHKSLLGGIAKERITEEFEKLLLADNPFDVLTQFSDVFADILGIDKDFDNILWKENVRLLCSAKKIFSVRLSLLLDGFDAKTALEHLKLDRKTTCNIMLLSKFSDFDLPFEKTEIKKLLSKIGCDNFLLVLEKIRAKNPSDAEKSEEVFEKIIADNECFSLAQLEISGKDLLDSFGIHGRRLGEMLSFLLDAVICEKCKNEKCALIGYASKNLF
ncbi:MAG: CCA tRNA nucleotidyltransferase [Clostridia bacterium]|nr:CCA tRNA nucleotidyltransferase [Clostridia bacterium]